MQASAEKYYNLFSDYKSKVNKRIEDFLRSEIRNSNLNNYKDSIYEPIKYVMSGSGKRIRPLIVILSCKAFGGKAKDALDAAAAVEILHNFTLVHDDIMDNASSRRGRQTVHKKWNTNTAILSGDELIALSYKSLLKTKSKRIREIAKTFTEGIIEICEGQAMDKEFENNNRVTLEEYLLMIKKKTAAMVKLSGKIGAMIAEAKNFDIESIGDYSENIGMAFQIQDDLLDVLSNDKKFGKKIGGDIKENKKTYLYVKAMEIEHTELKKLYGRKGINKIPDIINFYKKIGVIDAAKSKIKKYIDKANGFLVNIKDSENQNMFKCFSDMLLNRSS